jgi:hypothetical protein
MTVYALSDHVEVPQFNRYPIGQFKQQLDHDTTTTFRTLRERGLYHHSLSTEPADRDQVQVHVRHPKVRSNGRKDPKLQTTGTYPAKFRYFAGRRVAELDYRPVIEKLETLGVKDSWQVNVVVEYPVRDSPT